MTDTNDAIPMTEPALLEPSFADAAKAIEGAADLPARTRSHWLCSLRQIAKALDKPMEIIPARWTATRFAVGRLHHARVGANAKTLANHKSNVRAALLWFGNEKNVPSRGMPFTPEWQHLRQQLPDRRARSVLSSLMRYCSARRIAPAAVDEAVIDGYMRYRAETTALASDAAARRAIARAWNGCVDKIEGWPAHRLVEPAVKTKEGPAWDDFPARAEKRRRGLSQRAHPHQAQRQRQAHPAVQAFNHSPLPGRTHGGRADGGARRRPHCEASLQSRTCSIPTSPNGSSMPTGRPMARSREPTPSTLAGSSCRSPARSAAWMKPPSNASMTCGHLLSSTVAVA